MEFFRIFRQGRVVETREMRSYDRLVFNKDTGEISVIEEGDTSGKNTKKWSDCSQNDFDETMKSFEYGMLMRRDSWHVQFGNPPSYGAVSERLQGLSDTITVLRDQIKETMHEMKCLRTDLPSIVVKLIGELIPKDETQVKVREELQFKEIFNLDRSKKRKIEEEPKEDVCVSEESKISEGNSRIIYKFEVEIDGIRWFRYGGTSNPNPKACSVCSDLSPIYWKEEEGNVICHSCMVKVIGLEGLEKL